MLSPSLTGINDNIFSIPGSIEMESLGFEEIKDYLLGSGGILFCEPNIVLRNCYVGRNIIAPNDKFDKNITDFRGYLPVERWIFSLTPAENATPIKNEGLSKIVVNEKKYVLLECVNKDKRIENLLFGKFRATWTLAKLLDIGPPSIPCHIHSSDFDSEKGEQDFRKGKLEAYFFPPIFNKDLDLSKVTTRLGLKPKTTKEDFIKGLDSFGIDDTIYGLCNLYSVQPFDSWVIPPGIVHAPGPYPTFELQLPQDDFNLLSTLEGVKLEDEKERTSQANEVLLKGLKETKDVVRIVDWEENIQEDFRGKYYHKAEIIHEEEGVIVRRILFGQFFGESIEIQGNGCWTKKGQERPFACLVWHGQGTVNGETNKVKKFDEFLAIPGTEVVFKNTDTKEMFMILTFYPLEK